MGARFDGWGRGGQEGADGATARASELGPCSHEGTVLAAAAQDLCVCQCEGALQVFERQFISIVFDEEIEGSEVEIEGVWVGKLEVFQEVVGVVGLARGGEEVGFFDAHP